MVEAQDLDWLVGWQMCPISFWPSLQILPPCTWDKALTRKSSTTTKTMLGCAHARCKGA